MNPSHQNFQGLRVVSFESRQAERMESLVREHGGQPLNVLSMKAVPIGDSAAAAVEMLADRLARREVDALLLLTGEGTRWLFERLLGRFSADDLAGLLADVQVVSRGPKPAESLAALGVRAPRVEETAGTWRAALAAVDRPDAGVGGVRGASAPEGRGAAATRRRVAVQESGAPNWELLDALKARGADVLRVAVYRWSLPDDVRPLHHAVDVIARGESDIVLFTNSAQVAHVFAAAEELGLEEELHGGLDDAEVVSIGPACSAALKERGVAVSLEASEPTMETLIREAAERCPTALVDKRRMGEFRMGESAEPGARFTGRDNVGAPDLREGAGTNAVDALRNSAFLKACRLEATTYTPVWLLRQAGRYLPEYRRIRRRVSLMELCKTPELVAEVTVGTVRRLGVDAGILFSDLLLILEALGASVTFARGGPVIETVRSSTDIDALTVGAVEARLEYVFEAVRQTRRALPAHIPLIGFAGAPFTLASYLIEGKGSRDCHQTKQWMYRHPGAWNMLLDRLADAVGVFLNAQIDAGVQAVQVFDSWVGCLHPDDYRRYVLPHVRRVFEQLPAAVPSIHFGVGTGALLEVMREAGGRVMGLDWRVDVMEAWDRLPGMAVQGNLDPDALFAEPEVFLAQARRLLDRVGARPGFIFNLGHGVLPRTPVDHVVELVRFVQEYSRQLRRAA